MPTAFTISRGFWVLLLYYLGLLPFISIPERFLISFLPTIINRYLQGPRLPSSFSPRLLSSKTPPSTLHQKLKQHC